MKQTVNSIVNVSMDSVIEADWNYKVSGSPDDIKRLAESIKHDKSAGVPAVREVVTNGKTVYEFIDGNHRLAALRLLGARNVTVENFGPITKAEAVTIARRRNHSWFEEDALALAELYKDVVLPEIPAASLATFMPETVNDIDNIVRLLDAPWRDTKQPVQAKAANKAAAGITLTKKTLKLLKTNRAALLAEFKVDSLPALLEVVVERACAGLTDEEEL